MSSEQQIPNRDSSYIAQSEKYMAKQSKPYLTITRGANQYMWLYGKNGLATGMQLGFVAGVGVSFATRKLRPLFVYPLVCGVTYSAFHVSSAFFRNEL